MQIKTLNKSIHERKNFDCGDAALNNYLKQISGQHDKKDISRTFVLTSEQTPETIKGYYSLSLCKVKLDELPDDIAKKYPTEVYCALIGRLAVHSTLQGQGLGSLLLMDAIKEAVTSSIPTPMIVIDAKSERVSKLYQSFGFMQLPNQPRRLFMATKDAKATLVTAGVLPI